MSDPVYDVYPMPPSLDEALRVQLQHVETATVGHFRMHGFMHARLLPNQTGARVAGTAITVRTSGIDSTAITLALDAVRPGDVLIIDRGGEDRHAAIGAVLSAALAQAGVVAIVIDGRACDLTDIRRQNMPLWCTGSSPILGRRLNLGGGVNVPVNCGGVSVHPGDAVLADDTGILVLPPTEVAAVVTEALDRQRKEVALMARMAAGERLTDIARLPRFADHLSTKP